MFIRILTLLFFLLVLPVYASANTSPSFLQVEPVYSANQVSDTQGYFDVDVTPGEELTLHVKLKNKKESPITVRVEEADAYTSPSGGVFYDSEVESEDTVLLNDAVRMTDFIQAEETVTIPASDSIEVPVQVTVPDSDEQTLLGGIKVTQVKEKEETELETKEDEAKFVINTETTYAIAIKLNLPHTSEPNFSTGKAGFISENANVFLEMKNDAHLIQEKVTGTYAVLDSNGTELFNGDITEFNMAPKTQIRFPFAWNHDRLEDGNYTLVVNGHAGEKEFSVEETFTISTEEVNEYAEIVNPEVVAKQGMSMWVWVLGAIGFGLGMFFLGRRKKAAAE